MTATRRRPKAKVLARLAADALTPPPPRRPAQLISLRIDPDVLAWFRANTPRYQSGINAVLRGFVTAQRFREAK